MANFLDRLISGEVGTSAFLATLLDPQYEHDIFVQARAAIAKVLKTGAELSQCKNYRYALWRRWSEAPAVLFVMLNPSTADESQDDATIRRCIAFAQQWGHGGIIVANLFALRSPYPRQPLSWHQCRNAMPSVSAACRAFRRPAMARFAFLRRHVMLA